jgi:hypothetical protein
MFHLLKKSVSILVSVTCFPLCLTANQLLIGASTTDITPKLPVALEGQFNLRVADTVETPLSANIIALESIKDNTTADVAIMVSCDLIGVPASLLGRVRKEVHRQLPGLDVSKIFLNGIHTHTAPVLENDTSCSFRYTIPENGVTKVEEYDDYFVHQVSDAIVKAWNTRKPGTVSWGLSHAAIAYSRRIVYSKPLPYSGEFSDGTARMYGNTDTPEFSNLEGTEDHDVNILFFWNSSGKPVAMAIDIPCPAQEVENRSAVNADYWYPVREKLKQTYGDDICVLGWIGAAGDQSPRPLYRKAAEARMIDLRHLTRLQEISRRIVAAVNEAYETVKNDRYADVQLIHKVESLDLPMRIVTDKEYALAKSIRDTCAAQIAREPKKADDLSAMLTWNADVMKRYRKQTANPAPVHNVELHIIRIGDIVICTNEFELFTDYGLRMQARSKALQTFVIQLAGDGSYLPTEKAVSGGGYSAVIQSDVVSPAGGQILVDTTVRIINSLFP